MKIAIPVANQKLCMHFGHCQNFEIFDVDKESKLIISKETQEPPAHEPGVLPAWLAQMNVTCIIAGGMGSRAQNLFSEKNITVVVGAESKPTEKIVEDYLNGCLISGENTCDH